MSETLNRIAAHLEALSADLDHATRTGDLDAAYEVKLDIERYKHQRDQLEEQNR